MSVVHTPTHRACFISSLTASWKAHCLQGEWVWRGASELPTDSTDAAPARAHSDNQEWLWSCFSHRIGLLCNMDKGPVKMDSSLTKTFIPKGETVHTHTGFLQPATKSATEPEGPAENLPVLLFTATDTFEPLFLPIGEVIQNIMKLLVMRLTSSSDSISQCLAKMCFKYFQEIKLEIQFPQQFLPWMRPGRAAGKALFTLTCHSLCKGRVQLVLLGSTSDAPAINRGSPKQDLQERENGQTAFFGEHS